MVKLGKSLMLRYQQQLGDDVHLPADYYLGRITGRPRPLIWWRSTVDTLRGESWERFKDAAELRNV